MPIMRYDNVKFRTFETFNSGGCTVVVQILSRSFSNGIDGNLPSKKPREICVEREARTKDRRSTDSNSDERRNSGVAAGRKG